MLLLSITKWCCLLISQLLVYNGDRQAPPDCSNLLPEGTDLVLTHGCRVTCQYWHSHVGKPVHHWAEDLLDPKDTSGGIVGIYQIQRICNSHVLSSYARLVHGPWYNRERSIQSDKLYNIECCAMLILSHVSWFFTLNQIKFIIYFSSPFHSLLLPS